MKRVTYSITYSQVTPESAEVGDFSETGYVYQDIPYERGDLQDFKREGFDTQGYHAPRWFSTAFECIDYGTGTEEERSLHFDGVTPATLARIGRYLDGKPVLGGSRK